MVYEIKLEKDGKNPVKKIHTIKKLIAQNLDPFPFERLEKGRRLIALIQKALLAIEGDNLI